MKEIHFESVSRYNKRHEPANIAIPWKKGELWNEMAEKGVITDTKNIYPSQHKVTAYWEDGSIKWLLIRFLADLPANEKIDYYYKLCDGELKPEKTKEVVQIEDTSSGGLYIKNGTIEFVLSPAGEQSIFQSVSSKEGQMNRDGIYGPVIKAEDGREFILTIGENWEVVESGPIYGLVRTKGKHYDQQGKSWMDYTLMIHVWAGKPWINLDYQIINREEDQSPELRKQMALNNEQAGLKYDRNYPRELIRQIKVQVKPEWDSETVNHKILTSSFNYFADSGDVSTVLNKKITADTIVNTANEMFPEVMFSVFTGDWNNGTQAFSAGIYQAYQNFPKAMETGKEGIELFLLPEMEPMLELPQGVARTSRFYLYLHNSDITERLIMDRALMMEMPPAPTLDPAVYMEAGVFGNLVYDKYSPKTERFLYRYVDSRAKGLGMLHFGDGPEWEYMKQGRSEGDLIWINNEYDMPHNFMIMLARTGDRRYFDYMKASAEHWYDVDLCHYSNRPYRKGLLCTHSVNHISGQAVPSHQWVEGFLDYYHLTGNPNGLEAAMTIGAHLLELMELPLYHSTATVEPREIGWAMRTFIALYKETNESQWLDACSNIVDVYVKWQEELGTWTTPYPDNYMDRVPFMIHVGVAGLYEYYKLRPEKRIKETLLAVIDDMVKECYSPLTDMFYGKQFPAVRFQNLNGMILESLAIAYELTSDESYIKKGLGMFQWITVENQPAIYDFSKYKEDEYTVIYNCQTGPKRCAQSLLPILHYYRYLIELGYLDC